MKKLENSAACVDVTGINHCVKQKVLTKSAYSFSFREAIGDWCKLTVEKDLFSGSPFQRAFPPKHDNKDKKHETLR